jgi:hypothetical protein
MATGRADLGRDDLVLVDLLTEIRGMRADLRGFGERMAAHPEAPEVRDALKRLALVEQRESAQREREEQRESAQREREAAQREREAKLEARIAVIEGEVQTLKTKGAANGVTITAAHKVAGAVMGLIVMAVVWFAARVTAPAAPENHPPVTAPAHP